MNREECLNRAKEIVTGNKEAEYGSPEDNFSTIANLWGAYLNEPIKTKDVAVMMIMVKLARISSGHAKDDNWVDIAGYAACGSELESAI